MTYGDCKGKPQLRSEGLKRGKHAQFPRISSQILGGQDEAKEVWFTTSTEPSSKPNDGSGRKPKGIWSSGKVHSGGCLGTSRR